jgi:hypothetical protein
MKEKKMRLLAYTKLLNRKINSANNKAKNPFLDYNSSYNPFSRPIYNTLVWIESDENLTNEFGDK